MTNDYNGCDHSENSTFIDCKNYEMQWFCNVCEQFYSKYLECQ